VNPLWIWLLALASYIGFSLWYNNLRGPLSPAEVESYMARFEATPDADPERSANARAFLEGDDGGELFIVNLIRLHPDPVPMVDSGELRPAAEVLQRYTSYFMPGVFRRAGHPAFIGPAAGGPIERWGVEPGPRWTFAGIVRYRSRRDLMELATNPAFEPAHAYKVAAMASTLAFPVAPATLLLGPRVWVALVLGLLAALAHLIVRR